MEMGMPTPPQGILFGIIVFLYSHIILVLYSCDIADTFSKHQENWGLTTLGNNQYSYDKACFFPSLCGNK